MENEEKVFDDKDKLIESLGQVNIKNNNCEGCKNLSREFAKLMALIQRDAPEVWDYYIEHLGPPKEAENEGQSEASN